MNKSVSNYPALQFSIFRIIFGIYLTIHFLHLIPSSPDIWGRYGLFADASMNFTFGKFPNLLYVFDSPMQIRLFIGFNALLALFYTLGVCRRIVSVLLWYSWACLFHRNNLILNPGLPMVGWVLLASALIPVGEPLSLQKPKTKEGWGMPSVLFYGAWIIAGVSYMISGVDKFMAPSWRDGSAMLHLLNNPLARDWPLRSFFLSLPIWVIYMKTWGALLLEIAFGPLCISKRTRPIAWILIMGMHAGILSVVDFADLTLGVMMFHLFTFDPNWFHPKVKDSDERLVLFDGVCGMCNGWVNFIMSIDTLGKLKFSPLQGATAKKVLGENKSKEMDSIIYYENGKLYQKSTAVLKILRNMGGIWVSPSAFLIVPASVRDLVYGWIAKNRYKIFGKKDQCRMPTPEERSRFLD